MEDSLDHSSLAQGNTHLSEAPLSTPERAKGLRNFTPLPDSILPKQLRDALEKRRYRKEINRLMREAKNDNEEPDDSIQILKEVIYEDSRKVIIDATENIQREMNHISQTTSPELNTDRTQVLQDIADRMTEGLDIQTQIVIMNRGHEPNAFVFPDGTICISQSLINKMDSLDEVAAIIAHEINHLRFKTFQEKNKASGVQTLGVGWTHELASDIATPQLLVKAGFNSGAFASAIQKHSERNSRGTVHQADIARATEVKALHLVQDFATSDQEYTPLPMALVQDFSHTNEEISHKCAGNFHRLDNPEQFILKLNKRDLKKTYSSDVDTPHKSEESHIEGMLMYRKHIADKLSALGYENADIDLFYAFFSGENLAYRGYDSTARSLNFLPSFSNVTEVLTAIEKAASFAQTTYGEMHAALFGSRHIVNSQSFMNHLMHRFIDVQFNSSKKAGALQVSESEFESVIDAIHARCQLTGENYEDAFWRRIKDQVCFMIYEYAKTRFAHSFKFLEKYDTEEVTQFFKKYADKGITGNFRGRTDPKDFKSTLSKRITYRDNRMDPKEDEVHRFQRSFLETFTDEKNKIIIDLEHVRQTIRTLHEESSDSTNLNMLLKDLEKSTLPEDLTYDDVVTCVIEEIGNSQISCDYMFLDKDHGSKRTDLSDLEKEKMGRLYRLNFQLAALCHLYQNKREPQFYAWVEKLAQENKADIDTLSLTQLLNLFNGLGASYAQVFEKSRYDGDRINVHDFVSQSPITPDDALLQLYPIERIFQKAREVQVHTMRDFIVVLESFKQELQFNTSLKGAPSSYDSGKTKLYSNDVFTVLVGDMIRNYFNTLLAADVSDEDLKSVKKYLVDYFPEGVRRDQYVSRIDNRILLSQELSLLAKIQFLRDNFDSCGWSGLELLAKQIETLEDFRILKLHLKPKIESYLRGNERSSQAVILDVGSSLLLGGFQQLFSSADDSPEARKMLTSNSARVWLDSVLYNSFDESRRGTYNPADNTIRPEKGGGLHMNSFADMVKKVQAIGTGGRMQIALKALTDSGGAFQSDENRSKFAQYLLSALKIPDGFVRSALTSAIMKVDASTLSLPIAQMAAPLLFRAFDLSAIDIKGLHKASTKNGYIHYYYEKGRNTWDTAKHRFQELGTKVTRVSDVVPTEKALSDLLNADSQLLIDASIQTQSDLGKVFDKVRHQYAESLDLLDALLSEEAKSVAPENAPLSDGSLEAVIQGIESFGPIGVRSLQLASQLLDLTPEINLRLSRCLDANPGLSKLHFWHNLDNFMSSEPEVAKFMNEKVIRIGEYLGGGSLNTTFEAFIRTDDGGEKRVVIKMLNPNAKAVIGETYKAAHETLQAMMDESPQQAEKARTAMMLIDLAHQWCLKDICDPHFQVDDAAYTKHLESCDVSSEWASIGVYTPTVELETYRVKSEDACPGRSLNAVLKDPSIHADVKQRIVSAVGKIFLHEMTVPLESAVEDEKFMMRSDPHSGNKMVDISDTGDIAIGIIDRSMYLKMTASDMAIAKAILLGESKEAVSLLLDSIMQHNKVRDQGPRRAILLQLVKASLMQKISGTQNDMQMIQVLSRECARRSLEIPLQMRLLIKNIESVRRLTADHGIDLGEELRKMV